jgi:hypothetical protein
MGAGGEGGGGTDCGRGKRAPVSGNVGEAAWRELKNARSLLGQSKLLRSLDIPSTRSGLLGRRLLPADRECVPLRVLGAEKKVVVCAWLMMEGAGLVVKRTGIPRETSISASVFGPG